MLINGQITDINVKSKLEEKWKLLRLILDNYADVRNVPEITPTTNVRKRGKQHMGRT